MSEQGISKEGATFYSHLLPCLDTPAWKRNRVAGDGWVAVGDAAGLVDPITGEGLYYAMRSADLATEAILSESPELPAWRIARRCGAILWRSGIRLPPGAPCLPRDVPVGRGDQPHGAIHAAESEIPGCDAGLLLRGTQPYIGLKNRLFRNLNGSLIEIVCNLGFGRLIPRRDAA